MRTKDALLELADISTLYQYLYMSKDHFVIVNNGIADLKLYMDDDFNVRAINMNYPDLPPLSYNDMLFVGNLLGIIDYLKNDKTHIERESHFVSRWAEIKAITGVNLILNQDHYRKEKKQ